MGKPVDDGSEFSSGTPISTPMQQLNGSWTADGSIEPDPLTLINQGKLMEAEASYRELIVSGRADHTTFCNLAAICGMQGRFDEAEELTREAISLNPVYPDAYNNLGNIHRARGMHECAARAYEKATQLKPDDSNAFNALGAALKGMGDLKAAVNAYRQAIAINPLDADSHINLGNTLMEQGKAEAASQAYAKAVEARPDHAEAHFNFAIATAEQGRNEQARAAYKQALRLKADYSEAQLNLAILELLNGDYNNGLKRYEHRFRCKDKKSILIANPPHCQRYSGDLASSSPELVVISEQGIGDTLQFMRYMLVLRNQGIKAVFCEHAKLHGLIQASGVDTAPLTPEQTNAINQGFWVPLLSLPALLGVSPDNPIITEPYIRTTHELTAKWHAILAGEKRPIIGINWQGNPKYEQKNSHGRSLPLETFAPIAEHIHASLLSLQKGFGSEQMANCSFRERFVSCQRQVDAAWDFLETAAIISNCDLVITSDTAVAHLAGGMGKPTWLLLKQVPDWRWGSEGDTSFWYPSMRLFRQTERGNWADVMERVTEALQNLCRFQDIAIPDRSHIQPSLAEATKSAPTAAKPLAPIITPISLGELIDKITILQIKTQHLKGTALQNVYHELTTLEQTLNSLDIRVEPALMKRLQEVNSGLWQIEDEIREKERNQDFGEGFIRLARSVYQQNDRRAAIKKQINSRYRSALVEEKSYRAF